MRKSTDRHFVWRCIVTGTVLLLAEILASAGALAVKVPITVWLYSGNTAVVEWAKSYETKFNAANPDIQLSFQMVAYTAVTDTVLIASAAGTGPDISYLGNNLIPEQISRGMTLPLNRYLDKYVDKGDFIPELFQGLTDGQGQIHAMPYAMWSVSELYNKDILGESGVSFAQDWESMIAMVRKLTQMESNGRTVKRWGYVATQDLAMPTHNLHMAMEQLGKGMLYFGDTKVDLNNERGVKAATYLRDLWQAGMPDFNAVDNRISSILANKIAIYSFGTYNLLDIPAEESTRFELRRVVGPQPGQDGVRYGCGTLYVLKTSKHPDEAWRVLADFLNPENSESYIKAQVSYLPVRRSVLSRMSRIVTHPLAINMANVIYSPIYTYGPLHSYWVTLRTEAGDIFRSALQGRIGITGALEEAERKMNDILAEKMGIKK